MFNQGNHATMMFRVEDENAMEQLGSQLAVHCPKGSLIYFQGGLGAGKTTCVRGFLRGLGYAGKVKSPTYTLVEPYQLDEFLVYHFDLYRITDPQELETMGLRDYLDGEATCLLEWPERASAVLTEPDLWLQIDTQPRYRQVTITANTPRGQSCLQALASHSGQACG